MQAVVACRCVRVLDVMGGFERAGLGDGKHGSALGLRALGLRALGLLALVLRAGPIGLQRVGGKFPAPQSLSRALLPQVRVAKTRSRSDRASRWPLSTCSTWPV